MNIFCVYGMLPCQISISLTNFMWDSCHWFSGLVAHFLHLSGGKIKISGSGCEQKKNGHLSGCIWQEYKY